MKIYSSLSIFPVPDARKTAEFYETKMGFRRVDYLESTDPHICLYRDGVEIVLTPSVDGRRVIPNRELYGRGEDAYIITDSQEELQEQLRKNGVEIVEELHMSDYHNYEFRVADCDGRHIIFGVKQWAESDDKIWDELYSRAVSLLGDRYLTKLVQAGGVAAALVTDKGNIYTGVCIDTASSLGMCAERNAIANMITNGENNIRRLVAVMSDKSVGLPCGACRELMMQLHSDSKSIEILSDLEKKQTVTLGELTPDWWGEKIIGGGEND